MTKGEVTIASAVKVLRRNTGESQQFFATRMRLSTKTLQLHESGRTPDVAALVAYWIEAKRQDEAKVQQFLTRAISDKFSVPPGWQFTWTVEVAP